MRALALLLLAGCAAEPTFAVTLILDRGDGREMIQTIPCATGTHLSDDWVAVTFCDGSMTANPAHHVQRVTSHPG